MMKKSFCNALLFSIGIIPVVLSAGWKEEARNWNKYDADKLLKEQRSKYDVNKYIEGQTLGSDITNVTSNVNNYLDFADSIGLDSVFGGAISEARSLTSMINNNNYQTLLQRTGLEVLGAIDSSLLSVCYHKSIDFSLPVFKMPDIKIDPCIKFNIPDTNLDVCEGLPDIPGYKKKSQSILDFEEKNVKLFCGEWNEDAEITETSIKNKLLFSDGTKSITMTNKIEEDTNVIEKIKRSNIDDVGSMSDFKFIKVVKDKDGNEIKDEFNQTKKITLQPLKDFEKQDTEDKRNAYKYVKSILEKEAIEGKEIDDIEESKKLTLAHLDKANIAYKNEHEYELARNEAVNAYNFIEKDVFDTKEEVLLFKTKVIEYENSEKNVSKKVGQIKAEKENLMIQYKKRVDKWLRVKEAYYFEYEKKGIAAPTRYYIDSVTKNLNSNEKYVKRASLVYQVDKEMNFDAQHISKLRNKAIMLINEFERKLDLEIVANRKFDIEAAMESVGLTSSN